METLLEMAHGVNLMELEHKVKTMYREVALRPEGKFHFEMGRAMAERLGYPADLLDQVPVEAVRSFAGVGYHFHLADLRKGENVLDLGSGSGMDAFFAALQVGQTGEVIGVDMTPEQLIKAEMLRKEGNLSNVVFLKSYIEQLPVIHDSLDVVISNGVINLSGDKEAVFKETARVLKRGGRLSISDIVSEIRLPENISCNATLWAACIGGAMLYEDYCALIESSGFKILRVQDNPEYQFISKSAISTSGAYGVKSISLLAEKQ